MWGVFCVYLKNFVVIWNFIDIYCKIKKNVLRRQNNEKEYSGFFEYERWSM